MIAPTTASGQAWTFSLVQVKGLVTTVERAGLSLRWPSATASSKMPCSTR